MSGVRQLVPLKLHNRYVEHLSTWEPFNGGLSGFSCPDCEEELFLKPGEFWKRDGTSLVKTLQCKPAAGGCGFEGILRAMPLPYG